MHKCQLTGCDKKAVGEILIMVMGDGKPWYVHVCQEHLDGRKELSPDGEPMVNGYPQWKEFPVEYQLTVGKVGDGNNQAADSTILVEIQGSATELREVEDTGILRILDPKGKGDFLRFPYASIDRAKKIFKLASGTTGDVTEGLDLQYNDSVYIVFIEEEEPYNDMCKDMGKDIAGGTY